MEQLHCGGINLQSAAAQPPQPVPQVQLQLDATASTVHDIAASAPEQVPPLEMEPRTKTPLDTELSAANRQRDELQHSIAQLTSQVMSRNNC